MYLYTHALVAETNQKHTWWPPKNSRQVVQRPRHGNVITHNTCYRRAGLVCRWISLSLVLFVVSLDEVPHVIGDGGLLEAHSGEPGQPFGLLLVVHQPPLVHLLPCLY